jgi:molybdopterin-guanine dinucleotide biosynthesis protein A
LSGALWQALILAAGRGPEDAMASACGVSNKCAIPVGGVPMLARVAGALAQSGCISRTLVSVEDAAIVRTLLGDGTSALASARSAPASVLAAVHSGAVRLPLLITTADHPLLTPAMVTYFCAAAERSGADFCVGLASAETILAAYPETQRTFFRLGSDRVSGCNLFALRHARALPLLERWQYLEAVRKKPWRLVAAFGPTALAQFLLGRLSLDKAFAGVSKRLGFVARPILMPFAEAAIDVDKPADKDLAEAILAARLHNAASGAK